MVSLANLRAALATTLQTALGDGYTVSEYVLSSPSSNAVQIVPGGVEYHAAMGDGAQWWTFLVQAFLAMALDISGQRNADQFFENDPIKAAIEANRTLSGACDDLIVTGAEYRVWEHRAVGTVIGGEWKVRILI